MVCWRSNLQNSYVEKEGKNKSEKEVVDIKDALAKNPLFKKFMYSVMGYGLIIKLNYKLN